MARLQAELNAAKSQAAYLNNGFGGMQGFPQMQQPMMGGGMGMQQPMMGGGMGM